MSRTISIDPVTRIEGHLGIRVEVEDPAIRNNVNTRHDWEAVRRDMENA